MLSLPLNDSLTVGLYDSIKDYPARLQLEAKQYAIMNASLARSEEELLTKRSHIELLSYHGQKAEAHLEEYNYQLSVQLLEQAFNPLELEWACHLLSINQQPVVDYSEDSLLDRLKVLKAQGLTLHQIESSLGTVKERMTAETMRYYPNRVMKGKFNSLQRLLDYGLALAEHYEADSEESGRKLDQVTLSLLSAQKPTNLTNTPENSLIVLEKSQFKLYTTLQECGCTAPDALTVFQFYGWIEVLEERNERQKAALRKPQPQTRR